LAFWKLTHCHDNTFPMCNIGRLDRCHGAVLISLHVVFLAMHHLTKCFCSISTCMVVGKWNLTNLVRMVSRCALSQMDSVLCK
jgi:hypothetical protein